MSRIFFDYSTMAAFHGHPTGIPRTVQELASAFRNLREDIRIVALNDEIREFRDFDVETKKFGSVADIRNGDWLISTSASWSFSHYNQIVMRLTKQGVRYIQLYYDLIPYLFPHFYKDPGFGDYFCQWTAENFNLCTRALFISQCSQDDIVRCIVGRKSNIPLQVIRLGETLPTYRNSDNKMPDKLTRLGRFALSVGTLEIRKNHIILLNAYRFLIENGFDALPTLVLAGREGWLNNHLSYQVENDPVLKGRILVVPDASDAVLDYLYKNCMFTLFPSLYEGWGLPIAESLNYGKPCISSSTSSMVEVAPKYTRFAHPLKLSEWVAHIQELSANDKKFTDESSRIASEYSPFSWEQTASQILDSLK